MHYLSLLGILMQIGKTVELCNSKSMNFDLFRCWQAGRNTCRCGCRRNEDSGAEHPRRPRKPGLGGQGRLNACSLGCLSSENVRRAFVLVGFFGLGGGTKNKCVPRMGAGTWQQLEALGSGGAFPSSPASAVSLLRCRT